MSISYQAIFERMKKELNDINEETKQDEIIAKMYVVKSLADMVIESASSNHIEAKAEKVKISEEISEEEAKAMGISKFTKNKRSLLDDDDANGDSIFDF